MPAPLPEHEDERVATLRRYQLLDTPPAPALDELTRLAARICEAPIGLISLVDETRQWFKSRIGLATPETPRDQAFCGYAILDDATFVIEDAANDDRFRDNPLVTGTPHVRFYAGAPLTVDDGMRIGTLCVIDAKPRALTEDQLDALATLRSAVVSQIELDRLRKQPQDGGDLLVMCAWCERVRQNAGDEAFWSSAAAYLTHHRLVSHGVCPQCQAELSAST